VILDLEDEDQDCPPLLSRTMVSQYDSDEEDDFVGPRHFPKHSQDPYHSLPPPRQSSRLQEKRGDSQSQSVPYAPCASTVDDMDMTEAIAEVFEAVTIDDPLNEDLFGASGTDPSPFLPEPRNMKAVGRLPKRLQLPWINSFKKELKGLIYTHKVFSNREQPGPDDPVIPV
jgi:hypothetical protein